MFMGVFLLISGSFLYLLLKPPVSKNINIQEEFVFPKNPSLDGEGVAGCLTSQPYLR